MEHVLGAIDLDEPNEHINDTTEDHHTQYMKADGTRHDLASRHLIGTTWAAPAAPAALSATASAGVATDPARSDHVHPVGVWQDYTPAFVGESPTFGSGAVVEGRYMQVGDLVTGWGYFKLGTGFDSGVETAWRIELPVTARSEDASVSDSNLPIGTCEMKHLATGARFLGIASIAYGDPDSAVFRAENAGASYVASDAPFDWAATDWFIFHFSYEAA